MSRVQSVGCTLPFVDADVGNMYMLGSWEEDMVEEKRVLDVVKGDVKEGGSDQLSVVNTEG